MTFGFTNNQNNAENENLNPNPNANANATNFPTAGQQDGSAPTTSPTTGDVNMGDVTGTSSAPKTDGIGNVPSGESSTNGSSHLLLPGQLSRHTANGGKLCLVLDGRTVDTFGRTSYEYRVVYDDKKESGWLPSLQISLLSHPTAPAPLPFPEHPHTLGQFAIILPENKTDTIGVGIISAYTSTYTQGDSVNRDSVMYTVSLPVDFGSGENVTKLRPDAIMTIQRFNEMYKDSTLYIVKGPKHLGKYGNLIRVCQKDNEVVAALQSGQAQEDFLLRHLALGPPKPDEENKVPASPDRKPPARPDGAPDPPTGTSMGPPSSTTTASTRAAGTAAGATTAAAAQPSSFDPFDFISVPLESLKGLFTEDQIKAIDAAREADDAANAADASAYRGGSGAASRFAQPGGGEYVGGSLGPVTTPKRRHGYREGIDQTPRGTPMSSVHRNRFSRSKRLARAEGYMLDHEEWNRLGRGTAQETLEALRREQRERQHGDVGYRTPRRDSARRHAPSPAASTLTGTNFSAVSSASQISHNRCMVGMDAIKSALLTATEALQSNSKAAESAGRAAEVSAEASKDFLTNQYPLMVQKLDNLMAESRIIEQDLREREEASGQQGAVPSDIYTNTAVAPTMNTTNVPQGSSTAAAAEAPGTGADGDDNGDGDGDGDGDDDDPDL